MTHGQIVNDLVQAYLQTLPSDPSLAEADFEGFLAWAWSDDEPLRAYDVDADIYRQCLRDAYTIVREPS